MESIVESFFKDIEPLFIEIDGVIYAPAIALASTTLEAAVAFVVLGCFLGFLIVEPLSLFGCWLNAKYRKHLKSREKFGVTVK